MSGMSPAMMQSVTRVSALAGSVPLDFQQLEIDHMKCGEAVHFSEALF